MSARQPLPLEVIQIASPCKADWDSMQGDDRVRHCGLCQLNVYNLSGMEREEAEALIAASEGRMCVRFYRRADGTVLTADCPVAWWDVRWRIVRLAACIAAIFAFLSGGLLGAFWRSAGAECPATNANPFDRLADDMDPSRHIVMGAFCPAPPLPPPPAPAGR